MKTTLIAAAAALAIPAAAQAHFLLEYTTDTMIETPGDVPVKLIFWHPFENGHVMDLETPEAFFMIHNGEKTDLLGTLVPHRTNKFVPAVVINRQSRNTHEVKDHLCEILCNTTVVFRGCCCSIKGHCTNFQARLDVPRLHLFEPTYSCA